MSQLECGCHFDGTNVVFNKCQQHAQEALIGSVGLLLPIHWVAGVRPRGAPGEEYCRLMGTIEVAGVDFHLDCIQVETDNVGTVHAVSKDSAMDAYLEDIIRVSGGQCQTVKIAGREYYVIVHPFER